MQTTPVLVEAEISNFIGVLTLNNPAKHNSLSKQVLDELCTGLQNMRAHDVRVVILRAPAGSKVFSSGHDVRELPTNGRDPLTYGDPLRHAVRKIEQFPAPVIALIEGSVWGGACELVMSCDILIAGDDTTFAITPAKLGVPYNVSGVQNFLSTGGMHLCKEMLFTAQPLSVDRLVNQGIVSYALPRDQLESKAWRLAEDIAKNSPLVVSLLKEELRLLSSAHNLSPETFEKVQSMRREVYDSNDYREGILSFIEKRVPQFRGN